MDQTRRREVESACNDFIASIDRTAICDLASSFHGKTPCRIFKESQRGSYNVCFPVVFTSNRESNEGERWMVSAGDLSTSSDELEAELSQIFDIADHWNAILLLGEADIFLQKRDLQSLERNDMVSVFLRLLEYFQSILVLPTNRVETFDGAVQSMVNLPLKFNDFDEPARKAIWTTFLKKSCKVSGGRDVTVVISLDQLNGLARKELNGREVHIKNTVHMTHSLAVNTKVSLSYTHLEDALSVTEEFRHDLADLGQNIYVMTVI
ncbi:MAG: hypothetical protein M1839_001904 [Geoglossum umbratile]|nr:MAG: hypothetical protein M1839_001904 [Geoglossum umbratile]